MRFAAALAITLFAAVGRAAAWDRGLAIHQHKVARAQRRPGDQCRTGIRAAQRAAVKRRHQAQHRRHVRRAVR